MLLLDTKISFSRKLLNLSDTSFKIRVYVSFFTKYSDAIIEMQKYLFLENYWIFQIQVLNQSHKNVIFQIPFVQLSCINKLFSLNEM